MILFIFVSMHRIARIESVSQIGIACYHGAELILENKTDDFHKFDSIDTHSVQCLLYRGQVV